MNYLRKSLSAFAVFSLFVVFSVTAEEPPPSPPHGDAHLPPGPPPPPEPAPASSTMQKPGTRTQRIMTPPENFFENFPESEREELKKLAKENPMAFRFRMMKFYEENRKKQYNGMMDLRKTYLESTDETKKAEARAELKKLLEVQHKRHLSGTERQIRMTETRLRESLARLDELKKQFEETRASSDQVVEDTVIRFLDPANEPQMRQPLFPDLLRKVMDGDRSKPPREKDAQRRDGKKNQHDAPPAKKENPVKVLPAMPLDPP